jgi:hypothetical protein
VDACVYLCLCRVAVVVCVRVCLCALWYGWCVAMLCGRCWRRLVWVRVCGLTATDWLAAWWRVAGVVTWTLDLQPVSCVFVRHEFGWCGGCGGWEMRV